MSEPVEEVIKAVEFRTARSIELGRVKKLGKIYVIGYGPYIKIGYTEKTVESRIENMKTGIPEEVQVYAVIPGVRHLERTLHRQFAHLRTQREWFRKDGELADWIERGCPTRTRQIPTKKP